MVLLLCFLALSGSLPVATGCENNHDCSLLGACTDNKCVCRPGWTGSSCSRADLKPLDVTRGYQNASAASWGGRPFQTSDGAWHLIATEIANQCPLLLFFENSQVVRAKSTSGRPDGPYQFEEVLFPPFHHNPTYAGPTADGTYLVFFIGASNASAVVDCTNGVPHVHRYEPDSNNFVTMAWTKDPVNGPWQQRVILDDHLGNQSFWRCKITNPAAHVFPNGTTVVALRANNCDNNPANIGEHLGIAVASHWTGEFVMDGQPIVSPQSQMTNGSNNEDPFLWMEPDGSWHIVDHQQGQNNLCGSPTVGSSCAAHFFATNVHGPWHMSQDYVYNENVTLVNGSTARWKTRQRPQLIFKPNTTVPAYLITGASFEGNNPDPHMLTHTYFQEFNH